jgi:hypothetical protein
MKTPVKEKAEELIEKFTFWNTAQGERDAIKSASKAVEEIINALDEHQWQNRFEISWWIEVKQEIDGEKDI